MKLIGKKHIIKTTVLRSSPENPDASSGIDPSKVDVDKRELMWLVEAYCDACLTPNCRECFVLKLRKALNFQNPDVGEYHYNLEKEEDNH